MKQLVVISGKGGTGKTSIVASFAALAREAVLADCDVDAADLHLILEPEVLKGDCFSGGKRGRIEAARCMACGVCLDVCRFDAVSMDGPANHRVPRTCRIDPISCEGCGVCAWFCPQHAIECAPVVNGTWYLSRTRFGPMVHARLGVAEENSGKLVSLVRTEARAVAERQGIELVLIDGSPGIGCPVISSMTGADLALIVTEPTLSGLHDLNRVAELTRHFQIPAMVCINKGDLNAQLSAEIEAGAGGLGIPPAGRVRYDHVVTEAQVHRQSVVEYSANGCAADVRQVWSAVLRELELSRSPLTS